MSSNPDSIVNSHCGINYSSFLTLQNVESKIHNIGIYQKVLSQLTALSKRPVFSCLHAFTSVLRSLPSDRSFAPSLTNTSLLLTSILQESFCHFALLYFLSFFLLLLLLFISIALPHLKTEDIFPSNLL